MADLVYFSSVSENTHRFIAKLGRAATRIPLHAQDPVPQATEPYVLVVPTYGGGDGHGAVPKQVIRYLNVPENRAHLKGVISAGNTNFGTAYGLAGDIIAQRTGVPHLYRFELFGTPDDVETVDKGLDAFWQQQRTPPSTA